LSDINWILPALASPIVYAAVSIGDKRIISNLGLRLGSFFVFVGTTQLSIGLAIIAIAGWPHAAPASALLSSYAGGFLWGSALMLVFFVLQREEVSRVTPVAQSSPVFAAIFAVLFLGETLAWYGYLAVLFVVAGAAGVSLGRNGRGLAAFAVRPTFFMLLAGAAMIGLAQLLLKVASEDLGVWHNMAFRGIGLWTPITLPWLRQPYISGLAAWLKHPSNAVSLLLTDSLGPRTGNFLLLMAIANGPVALVSALLGSRPVFVLAGALFLGLFAKGFINERFTKADLLIKGAATASVVTGVVIISVS